MEKVTVIVEDTLGQRIKAQRNRMGITQEELAFQIGVSVHTIWRYENLNVNVRCSKIKKLAKALSTDPDYLLLGMKELAVDACDAEIVELFNSIPDERVKKNLLEQLAALAYHYSTLENDKKN